MPMFVTVSAPAATTGAAVSTTTLTAFGTFAIAATVL
jgi:hypothetical protein